MQSYENLFGKKSKKCIPDKAIKNHDDTRKTPNFQQLLRSQAVGTGSSTSCPTGPTGCSIDPYFHFPNLDRDTSDCLYIPTFTDVPITISMLTYFFDAFFKEVPFQEVQNTINQESKEIVNDIVYGNIYFNYIPLTVLLLVIIWVFIIHGTINWETGVFLTAVIITVLWLGFLLFDTYTRGITDDIFTRIYDEVKNNFQAKNEAIICNILKGYYAGINHMILPEAALYSSPTGNNAGPCDCFDTGIKIPDMDETIKIPHPAIIINDQIRIGGSERYNGINNNDTLLPLIDKACPCISDIEGFTLDGISSEKKSELIDCILDTLPKDLLEQNPLFPCKSRIECVAANCLVFPDRSPALCKTVGKIAACIET